MSTPFERAGYTKDTRFIVTGVEAGDFSKGDIVVLYRDDGGDYPYFINEKGVVQYMGLPKKYYSELQVVEDIIEDAATLQGGNTNDTI